MNLTVPPSLTDLSTGMLRGEAVEVRRTVGDLLGYWHDDVAAKMRAGELLYVTQTWFPVPDGTEGAVLWGNTVLFPGDVGSEYFMTRGHFHLKRDRCELCITVSGKGALVLMDEARNVEVQDMSAGTTHYVHGHLAHRTVNTGDEPLVFLCAWPADCGHDYEVIKESGFARRLFR
ncbi:MAG TPA: glucose-6-phosphate isomerase family protein [Fimbriimonas sp.]|nr:glucose-6-phosphate isomerase family protein [Fimbriimonas sp.]